MATELSVIPANIELPAHLRTPEAIAAAAAANAAAAGGIKAGGFPSISIKANKFHIKENGELNTLMMPAQGTQPALPLMCLEVVVVGANPSLIKTFFEGDFVEGEVKEPTCRSSNGITPDADIAAPQNNVCATCKQNQWGSKVSKFSGKDIKACDDSKQLAVLPAADLAFKALGLQVHKGSLKNWGSYVNALSGRGYDVTTLVTNVTFDATQNGVLNFAFNRFLDAEQHAKAAERARGDDVKTIVAQSRTIVPQLPAPTNTALLPGVTVAAPQPAAPAAPAPAPVTPAPAAPAVAAPATGFGATTSTVQAPNGVVAGSVAQTETTPAAPARKRRTRAEIDAENAAKSGMVAPQPEAASMDPALAHLPPAILTAVLAVGKDSPAGQAMLAQFPAPAAPAAPVDPFAGQPAHVKPAVDAAGGLGTVGGDAVFAALKVAAPQANIITAATPAAVAPAPVVPATAATPAPTGFGGATAPAASTEQPSAAVTASAASLKEKLAKMLGKAA